MKILFVAIVVLGTFWFLNRKVKTKTALKITGNKITYRELANKRHNLHTAHNMITLGLIETPITAIDRHLSLIYDGVDTSENAAMARVADLYSLNPARQGFVGY